MAQRYAVALAEGWFANNRTRIHSVHDTLEAARKRVGKNKMLAVYVVPETYEAGDVLWGDMMPQTA